MSWPDSPIGGRLGDGRFANATDRPETVETLCRTLTERIAQGNAIYPQGGSTALDYGGVPRSPGVVIDTRALDKVIDYPHADMTVTVEAGITAAGLRVLAEKGQAWSSTFPSRNGPLWECTRRTWDHEVRSRPAARPDYRRELCHLGRSGWSGAASSERGG